MSTVSSPAPSTRGSAAESVIGVADQGIGILRSPATRHEEHGPGTRQGHQFEFGAVAKLEVFIEKIVGVQAPRLEAAAEGGEPGRGGLQVPDGDHQ